MKLRSIREALSFQRDWWEQMSKRMGTGSADARALEQAQLARIRAATRRY